MKRGTTSPVTRPKHWIEQEQQLTEALWQRNLLFDLSQNVYWAMVDAEPSESHSFNVQSMVGSSQLCFCCLYCFFSITSMHADCLILNFDRLRRYLKKEMRTTLREEARGIMWLKTTPVASVCDILDPRFFSLPQSLTLGSIMVY